MSWVKHVCSMYVYKHMQTKRNKTLAWKLEPKAEVWTPPGMFGERGQGPPMAAFDGALFWQ